MSFSTEIREAEDKGIISLNCWEKRFIDPEFYTQ